ncbi:MAG: twin-arginine translocase TatA/TatE family subunit [Muribaculaceae bacterium]|nr:twin-arginine translocase TatA/TatE family subunit [Muribaculaceae bacterium]
MQLNSIMLLFGSLGTPEVIIIVFVILLLFGGKKIPELMRGLGKGVRSFKQGMNEIEQEIKKPLEQEDDLAELNRKRAEKQE